MAADGPAHRVAYALRACLDSTFPSCWIPATHLSDGVRLEENQRTRPFPKLLAATKISGNRQTLFSFCYVQNQTFDSKVHFFLDFYQRLCDVFAMFLV
jgi:hypothetical protein